MVVAGGRPIVAIESAVARCQLRYHAQFFMDCLIFFHVKQTNTVALSRTQKKRKRKAAPSYFRAWIRLLCPWHLIECTVHLFATSRLSLSNSAGARRQHRCTPGLVGGLRIKKLETQTVVVSDTWYYILFPMNNYF